MGADSARAATVARRLFFTLLALYVLTMAGHTASPDEESLYYVTRSLVERGRIDLPPDADKTTIYHVPGPDGRNYSPYGLLPSLLQAPFYGVGDALSRRAEPRFAEYVRRLSVCLLDALVTALTAVLVFYLARDLGLSDPRALLTALAFGIATPAWVYARNLWSEPITALLLVLAAGLAIRSNRSRELRWAFLAGVSLGLTAASKVPTLVVVPVVLVYLLFHAIGPAPPLARIPVFVLGLGVPGAAMAWTNWIRFGDLLETGYQSISPPDAFTQDPLAGLVGLLLSPGKSVFVYAPIALVSLLGFRALARRRTAEAALLAGLVASHVLFYGSYYMWHGDAAWGPRYLVPVLPFLVIPAGFALEGRRAGRLAFALATAIGLVVQTGGVLVDPAAYTSQTGGTDRELADARRWLPGMSPVTAHLRIFAARLRDHADHRPPPVVLAKGFFESEDRRGALWPRWTTAEAELDVDAKEARTFRLHLRFGSYRPEHILRACVDVRVGGSSRPVQSSRVSYAVEPFEQVVEFTNPTPGAGPFTISLAVNPWTPDVEAGLPDGRELGVTLSSLTLEADGVALEVGRPRVMRLPVTDRKPWSKDAWDWFHREPHVADVWMWHVWHSGLPRWIAWLGIVPGLALVLSAIRLVTAVREVQP